MLDTMSLGDALRTASLVWCESVVGGVVIAACVLIGWRVARTDRGWLVHSIRWWLTHVLGPLLASRPWLRRALLIALNNSVICLAVMVLGSLGYLAWLGVVGVGLGLGSALQLMQRDLTTHDNDDQQLRPHQRVLHAIGMTLNLLEVPAVFLCAGLSLAQGALSSSLSLSSALTAFCYLVLPLLAVSAAGEAIWMEFNRDI